MASKEKGKGEVAAGLGGVQSVLPSVQLLAALPVSHSGLSRASGG